MLDVSNFVIHPKPDNFSQEDLAAVALSLRTGASISAEEQRAIGRILGDVATAMLDFRTLRLDDKIHTAIIDACRAAEASEDPERQHIADLFSILLLSNDWLRRELLAAQLAHDATAEELDIARVELANRKSRKKEVKRLRADVRITRNRLEEVTKSRNIIFEDRQDMRAEKRANAPAPKPVVVPPKPTPTPKFPVTPGALDAAASAFRNYPEDRDITYKAHDREAMTAALKTLGAPIQFTP